MRAFKAPLFISTRGIRSHPRRRCCLSYTSKKLAWEILKFLRKLETKADDWENIIRSLLSSPPAQQTLLEKFKNESSNTLWSAWNPIFRHIHHVLSCRRCFSHFVSRSYRAQCVCAVGWHKWMSNYMWILASVCWKVLIIHNSRLLVAECMLGEGMEWWELSSEAELLKVLESTKSCQRSFLLNWRRSSRKLRLPRSKKIPNLCI